MYRACHLALPEVIWIARGRDFAEIVCRLAPHPIAPVAWLLPAPFVLPLIVLIIVSDALLERLEAPPPSDPAALVLAPLIGLTLLFSNRLFFFAAPGVRSYWPGITVCYVLAGLFGISAVVLSVGPSPLVWLGAVLAMAVASLIHVTVVMSSGVRRRAALRSRLKISIPLTGAAPFA